MWFKTRPPKQDCSDEEWLARLKNALNAESPLLTNTEEAAMKAKYFKKFKKNITAFESSVVKVSLARRIRYKPNTQISVVRTATGAVALYQPFAGMNRIVSVNPSSIEMELNSDEWLNFVNAIHRYIGKWVKADCKRSPRMEFLPDDYWELSVFSENPDDKISRDVTSVDGCPIDWNGFTKFMND